MLVRGSVRVCKCPTTTHQPTPSATQQKCNRTVRLVASLVRQDSYAEHTMAAPVAPTIMRLDLDGRGNKHTMPKVIVRPL